MVGAAGSNQTPKVRTTATALSYNASTSALTATTFVGALSGNASTATALTSGDKSITGSLTVGGNLTINGTTTTINANTLTVDDKNIELGSVSGKTVTGSISGTTVTITSGNTSGIIPGVAVTGSGVTASTRAVTITNDTQFTVNNSQTVSSTTLTIGGPTDFTAQNGGITVKGTTDKTILWNLNEGWILTGNGTTGGTMYVDGGIKSSNTFVSSNNNKNWFFSNSGGINGTGTVLLISAEDDVGFTNTADKAITLDVVNSVYDANSSYNGDTYGIRVNLSPTGSINSVYGIDITTTPTDYNDTSIGLRINSNNTAIDVVNGSSFFKSGLFTGNLRIQVANAQDSIIITGREGGTSSRAVTLRPATLSASRIYTLPEVSTDADFVMTQGEQTIAGTKTFSSTISGTVTNATNVNITNVTTNADYPLLFTSSHTAGNKVISTDSAAGITYNPNTNNLKIGSSDLWRINTSASGNPFAIEYYTGSTWSTRFAIGTAGNITVGYNNNWELIKSSTTTMAHTTASSAPTLTLDSGKTIGTQEILALEVSSNSTDTSSYEKAIVFCKLGSFSTTVGIGFVTWSDLDSSTTGNPDVFSMLVRYVSSTSIATRYGGFQLLGSTGNKTFATVYIHRIWKVPAPR
jgi:hypothetical protein